MRKKVSATAANRRRPEDFLSRIGDIFEHKFDGFPAKAPPFSGIDIKANPGILDADLQKIIKDLLGNYEPTSSVPCPDQAGGTGSVPGSTEFANLTRTGGINPVYTAEVNVDRFLDVNVDNVPAIEGIDYTVSGSQITLLADPGVDAVVTARYVTAAPSPISPVPIGGLPATVTSVLNSTALAFAQDGKGWSLSGRDFFDYEIPQGEWGKPGGTYEFPLWSQGGWRWRQTQQGFTDSSGRGQYSGQYTTWVTGGEMREWIRNGPESLPFIHQASPVNRLVSRPLLIEPGGTLSTSNTTRRYAWRIDMLAKFPGDEANGYKCAWLMWGHAGLNSPGYAEEDIPEHKFGNGLRSNAFHHKEGTVGGQISVQLNVDTTQWHLYSLVYHAKGYNAHPTGYVEFWVDGVQRLRTTEAVSSEDVYYAKQSETFLAFDPLPTPTSTGPQGIIYTRLAQIWEP